MAVKFSTLDDFKRMSRAMRGFEALARDNRGRPNPFNSISAAAGACFPVLVKVDSGTASLTGSMAGGTTCGFTYSLFYLNGSAILDAGGSAVTGKTPAVYRVPNCTYHKPADNSLGLAYYDASGVIQLYDAAQERIPGTTVTHVIDVSWDGTNLKETKQQILVMDAATAGSATDIDVSVVCS